MYPASAKANSSRSIAGSSNGAVRVLIRRGRLFFLRVVFARWRAFATLSGRSRYCGFSNLIVDSAPNRLYSLYRMLSRMRTGAVLKNSVSSA
jgi:hypothetical protein